MAVNRYDRPIASQFINTYVPIPFEQMVQAGSMKQQRYDQSAAAIDASIAQAEQMAAIPGSEDARQRDLAVDRIYQIRDKYYGKDLSDSMIIRQLNNEIRSAVKPGDIKRWSDSYANWQVGQQLKQQQVARGEYNPYLDEDPASGYDSSSMGVYNYLSPTYKGKEETLNKYFGELSRHGRILGTTAEGYTQIGRTAEDIESVVARANEYASTPSGQAEIKLFEKQNPELAASLGSKDEIAKYIMRDYGQQFIWSDIRGSRTPVGRSGGGNPNSGLYGFSSSQPKRGDVQNRTAREVRQELATDKSNLSFEQTKLENMTRNGATPEEIQAQKAVITNVQEKIDEYENRIGQVTEKVNDAFAEEREAITSKYVGDIMAETDMTREEALDLLQQLDRIDLTETVTPSRMSPGQTAPSFRSAARDAVEGVTDNKTVNRKTRRRLTDYMEETSKYRREYNEALDQSISDEFSYTMGTREILMPQIKDTNGYYTIQSWDGEMYPSKIDPAVTQPLISSPSNWVIHTNDVKLEQRSDDLRKYIRAAALEGTDEDQGYRLEYSSMDRQIRPDGSLRLNYDLTGPKINDDTQVYVDLKYSAQEDRDAIENVFLQQYLQGDDPRESLALIQEMKSSMYYTPQANREGPGKYTIMSTGQEAEVKYENGEYHIYYPTEQGMTDLGTAKNREVLGSELARLDAVLMVGTLQ